MGKEELPYYEGSRALKQPTQRGAEASVPGIIPNPVGCHPALGEPALAVWLAKPISRVPFQPLSSFCGEHPLFGAGVALCWLCGWQSCLLGELVSKFLGARGDSGWVPSMLWCESVSQL